MLWPHEKQNPYVSCRTSNCTLTNLQKITLERFRIFSLCFRALVFVLTYTAIFFLDDIFFLVLSFFFLFCFKYHNLRYFFFLFFSANSRKHSTRTWMGNIMPFPIGMPPFPPPMMAMPPFHPMMDMPPPFFGDPSMVPSHNFFF